MDGRLERGFYVTFDLGQAAIASAEVARAYLGFAQDGDGEAMRRLLDLLGGDRPGIAESLLGPLLEGEIEARAPSADYPSRHQDREDRSIGSGTLDGLDHFLLAFRSADPGKLEAARRSALQLAHAGAVGSDLGFEAADHWCPGRAPGDRFGGRDAARRLIAADRLLAEGLDGRGVQVVVVDRGLDGGALGDSFGGGWAHCPGGLPPCRLPGQPERTAGVEAVGHGMMVARNLLDLAPGATLHDLPLVPPRITALPRFLSDAHAAFERVLADIRISRSRRPEESWVLVNAWAIFDRSSEVPRGDYSSNPEHPFNRLLADIDAEGVDLVFAAGNCGQFCADRRCGRYDVGPGRSVHGASAHPGVLSVGAVRADGLWIGASSQGPGPAQLAERKPDLSAPSLFSESHDRATRNGGTSAACATAGGVVAALRQRWPAGQVAPEALRTALRRSARRAGPPAWDGRLGWGVLNVDGALEVLGRR